MSFIDWLRAKKAWPQTPPQTAAPGATAQARRHWAITHCAPQRWVVVDLETSGLNLNRDQVLSIGAVVIEDGAVDLSQVFERTLHAHRPPSSGPACCIAWPGAQCDRRRQRPGRCVARFHGVRRRQPSAGVPRAVSINTCCAGRSRTAWVIAWPIRSWMWLTWPRCCAPEAHIREAGLDDWINRFNLQVGERHHASADALATAELMLILFSRRARSSNRYTARRCTARLSQWKRRQTGAIVSKSHLPTDANCAYPTPLTQSRIILVSLNILFIR